MCYSFIGIGNVNIDVYRCSEWIVWLSVCMWHFGFHYFSFVSFPLIPHTHTRAQLPPSDILNCNEHQYKVSPSYFFVAAAIPAIVVVVVAVDVAIVVFLAFARWTPCALCSLHYGFITKTKRIEDKFISIEFYCCVPEQEQRSHANGKYPTSKRYANETILLVTLKWANACARRYTIESALAQASSIRVEELSSSFKYRRCTIAIST